MEEARPWYEKARRWLLAPRSRSIYIRALCVLLLFSYGGIASATFMLLSCRDVAEGRYITAVPEISCESDGTHALFFVLAGIYQYPSWRIL